MRVTKTCYQVQAAYGKTLLGTYFDGDGEWGSEESGMVFHTLKEARAARNESMKSLPTKADDSIVVGVWCSEHWESAQKTSGKRKRKTERRAKPHFAVGSAMLVDRRWKGERRADKIDGRK